MDGDLVRRFQVAAEIGDVDAIFSLVRDGVDATRAGGLVAAVNSTRSSLAEKLRVIPALVEAGANPNVYHIQNNPLHHALRIRDVRVKTSVMRSLVDAGANLDAPDQYRGNSLLMTAAFFGDLLNIKILLELGANVNYANHLDGTTALYSATRNGNPEVIRVLCNAGADVNHIDSRGDTVILKAAQNGNQGAIRALVRCGADVNHADQEGRTALFYAAWRSVGAIAFLLEAGADVNHRDNTGRTVYELYGDDDEVNQILGAYRLQRSFSRRAELERAELARRALAPNFPRLDDISTSSISLKNYIVDIVDRQTNLGRRNPYNISLDKWEENGKMGLFFRYTSTTVASIQYTNIGQPIVRHLKAEAPICAGDGRVIYSKWLGERRRSPLKVYENSLNLDDEVELCHDSSGSNPNPIEKNWGCFGRTSPGNYLIVYSVLPLKILEVTNRTNCRFLPAVPRDEFAVHSRQGDKVKDKYPNLDDIERLYINERDANGTGIFRGATRGIDFDGEFLFVGHVTLHHQRNEPCFPNWFTARNTRTGTRMYFMYFYTIRLTHGMYKISRMSSCFQPPSSGTFHRIIFPCGIAHRGDDIVVSFGRDDKDCLITSYPKTEVNTMLAPVKQWNPTNYVFHPNYATSLKRASINSAPDRSALNLINRNNGLGLIGTSPESGGRFNPAITNLNGTPGTKYVTAWRKLNGSILGWEGYNKVALELCSIKIEEGKLVYKRESETIEFQAGTTRAGGEDPRLIMENGCPLMLVNDLRPDPEGTPQARRMYIHNLNTDESAMTIHPFCHNITPDNPRDHTREKNWGPFYFEGKLHFVYKVDPFVVGRVGVDFRCPSSTPTNIECVKDSEVPTAANLKQIFRANGLEMRGGTPGIKISENEYLFVGHSFQEDGTCFPDYMVERFARRNGGIHQEYAKFYMAFFYTIAKEGRDPWKLKRLSCCSHFPGKRINLSKIHFPGGIAKANLGGEFEESYIISFGESDQFGGFCAVNRKFVDYVLRPIEEWNVHNYVVDVNYFQNVALMNVEY